MCKWTKKCKNETTMIQAPGMFLQIQFRFNKNLFFLFVYFSFSASSSTFILRRNSFGYELNSLWFFLFYWISITSLTQSFCLFVLIRILWRKKSKSKSKSRWKLKIRLLCFRGFQGLQYAKVSLNTFTAIIVCINCILFFKGDFTKFILCNSFTSFSVWFLFGSVFFVKMTFRFNKLWFFIDLNEKN